jgi:hypothetical protein
MLKHACRTLLKQGHDEILEFFDVAGSADLKVENLKVTTPTVKFEGSLEFKFEIVNKASEAKTVRLEYAMYFLRANGSLSKKVFKISEKEYAGSSRTAVSRKYSFIKISTRRYYSGRHQVSIIINGNESDKIDFQLIE